LARALAQETGVMVLDEPTSALDFRNQLRIWETLKKLTKDGMSVVVSVHDPNHMLWFCDRVVVLHRGRIIANGKPSEVITQEILSTLYGNICKVKDLDGMKVVLPDTTF